MALLDATVALLRRAGAPLHYRDLAEAAVEEGLVEGGEASAPEDLAERLVAEIEAAGGTSPVVGLGEGVYALREWGVHRAPDVAAPLRVEIEREVHPEPERERPWATWLAGVLERLQEPPEAPFLRRAHGYLRGILAWGVVNIVAGLTLSPRWRRAGGDPGTLRAGLAHSLLTGGTLQTVGALAGLERVLHDDRALEDSLSATAAESAAGRYRRAAGAVAILGAVLGVLGLALGLLGRHHARARGEGLGLLTQGSFLLTLAAVGRWLSGED